VTIGRYLKRVPTHDHRARLLGPVDANKKICESENGSGWALLFRKDCLRQRVMGSMRERVPVDDKQGWARFCNSTLGQRSRLAP
jgi:hypothetical protein